MSGRFSRALAMFLVLFLGISSLLFMVFLLEEVSNEGFEVMLLGLLGLLGLGALLFQGPVGKAIAAMLEGTGTAGDANLNARLADAEDRLQELSLEAQRMIDLEDRLDFAERLLASQQTPAITPPELRARRLQ